MDYKNLESYIRNTPWAHDDHPDGVLWLLTTEEFHNLPDGVLLESINGEKRIKGVDDIDLDIRFGYISFGIRGHRV